MPEPQLELVAVTLPGLEEVTAGELRDLRARRVTVEPGGVAFRGDLGLALRANLWLRTATRVLWRLGTFDAPSFDALVRHTERLEWPGLLGRALPVEVRASTSRSRLRHSGAVSERVAGVVGAALGLGPARRLAADRYGVGRAEGPAAGPDREKAGHELLVRLERDQCTISLDLSGEPLHRRGYRLETAKAPLRETVAAALLRLAGWKGDAPLVDPLCGAGTIPIEAALVAARIPPGIGRAFTLERLPGFDPALRAAADGEARSRRRPVHVAIRGSDRDEGAVASACRNAERAGLGPEEIHFEQAPIGALRLTGDPGLVATNPPYGLRIGDARALRDLYATLGSRVAEAPSWRIALVTATPKLLASLGLPVSPLAAPVRHGALRLHLVSGPT